MPCPPTFKRPHLANGCQVVDFETDDFCVIYRVLNRTASQFYNWVPMSTIESCPSVRPSHEVYRKQCTAKSYKLYVHMSGNSFYSTNGVPQRHPSTNHRHDHDAICSTVQTFVPLAKTQIPQRCIRPSDRPSPRTV